MLLHILIVALFLFIDSTQLLSYQAARYIIEEQLVDNDYQQISIRSQLTEEEANEIIQFLTDKDIPSEKVAARSDQLHQISERIWEIHVSPTDTVEAIILLDEAELPNRKRSSLFEEFVNRIREGYTMTEQHQVIARQLEEYLEEKPGIVNAEVLIKWDHDPFQKKEILKTMVYIRHTGTLDDPHSELAEGIKSHVLESVDDLEEDHFIFITEKESPVNYKFPTFPGQH
jgi:type III secretory pathway lipoprotein EscJ